MQFALSWLAVLALLVAIVLLFVGIIRAIIKRKSGKAFAAMGICLGVVFACFIAMGVLVSLDSAAADKAAQATATTVRAETESEYKSYCVNTSYETLSRNPEHYVGKRIHITGKVSQLISDDGYMLYEDDNISGDTYMTMRWYVGFDHPDSNRILEGDTITFYGVFRGIKEYTSVLGVDEQAMGMEAEYYEIS